MPDSTLTHKMHRFGLPGVRIAKRRPFHSSRMWFFLDHHSMLFAAETYLDVTSFLVWLTLRDAHRTSPPDGLGLPVIDIVLEN